MTKTVDVQEFAKDVERLCDFLLDKVEKDGSEDVVVIQQLKDRAADIQIEKPIVQTLSGLGNYMKGVSAP